MKKMKAIGAFLVIAMLSFLYFPGNGVPILAYHQVSESDDIYSITAAQFAAQMEYLVGQGYTAISLTQLFEYYEGSATLPDKPIIITFDDGYEDNFLTALPIMEKYNMKSTVFVIPSLVGTTEYLSWQQIAEMKRRNTEIGSHTMTHIELAKQSAEEQQREVVDSKNALEQHIGEVKFLAYPYGSFSAVTEQILEKNGYKAACSGIAGLNRKGTDVYALRRINIPQPKYGLGEFRLRLLRANLYNKLGM